MRKGNAHPLLALLILRRGRGLDASNVPVRWRGTKMPSPVRFLFNVKTARGTAWQTRFQGETPRVLDGDAAGKETKCIG